MAADVGTTSPESPDKDKEILEIFADGRNRIFTVRLQNSSVLTKHKANGPIVVQCLSGRGTFYAGPELEESAELRQGTLLTLGPDIAHEVAAEDELYILVTKFQQV